MASTYDSQRASIEAQKIAATYWKEQYESAASALSKAGGHLSDLYEAKGKAVQDYQKAAMNAVSRIASTELPARIRGLVDLRELALTSQIDFAKAAYLPDRSLVDRIIGEVSAIPTSDEEQRKYAAWQKFYQYAQPDTGNLWGTYQEMIKKYGINDQEPESAITPENTTLWSAKQRVHDKLRTEKAAAENIGQTYAALTAVPGTYAEWARKHNLDPESDATRERFVRDLNLEAALPQVTSPEFVKAVQRVATMSPDTLEKSQAFTSPLDTGIKAAEAEVDFWKGQLPARPGEEDVETGDTFRDRLAAWVGRPETRQWAEANGLDIGQTVPLTDRIKQDIAEGKYPGHVFTKYGVYIPKPDDMVAFRKAYKQLDMRPERQVFRAAGAGYGGSTVVEVGLKAPPDVVAEERAKSPRIESVAAHDQGAVAKMSDGTYAASADGKTWKPIPESAAQQILQLPDVALEPLEEDVRPFFKEPPPKMFVGAWRPPKYGDAPGSVRFVNPENGKEAYIRPEDVAGQRFVNHAPGAHKPQPLDVVRKVATERLLKRAGLEQEPTPATGPAPTSATGSLPAPVRQAEPPAVPDVERMEQAQREKNRAVNERAIQRADKALEMSRARTPLGNPPPEATTRTTSTPTMSTGSKETDALRRKFKAARMSPAATVYAPTE